MTPDLSDLVGAWRVSRAIRHVDGTVARFRGTATWRPDGAVLRCEEAGRLRTGGGAMAATRATLWRAERHGIAVTFADGRPFHAIGPDAEVRHDCPPDLYRLGYDFDGWPRWTVIWRVTGPRKDYAARTRYAPA